MTLRSHFLLSGLLAASLALPAGAKPLITSSEETLARICVAEEEPPERLIDACTGALAQPGLTEQQRVDLLTSLGNAYNWSDQDETAAKVYRDALDLNPAHTEALNGLGWVLRAMSDDAGAYQMFERSLSHDVSSSALAGKAATGREIGELTQEEARLLLEAALSIDPDYTWARREMAWSFFDSEDYPSAMAIFAAVLKEDPGDLNARYGVARAALAAGENDRALSELNRLLEDAPDYYSARIYKIITLRALDRNAQALREADRLIADDPDSAGGYTERARSLMALQRRAEALSAFAEAEDIVGPDPVLLYWHADALVEENRLEDALAVITRATAQTQADSSDHLMRSYILLELKDYPASREAAETSLAIGGHSAWAHYYIAIALVHGGSTEDGLDRFDRAMESGLPEHRIGAFASELISAGKYVEAVQLRLKY